MKCYSLSLLIMIVGIMVVNSGCWGKPRPDGLPPLYRCTVTLRQDGKLLDHAAVFLYPEDTGYTWTIGGVTDATGVAVIHTHAQYPGVPTGEYKVVVSKSESVSTQLSAPPPEGADETYSTLGNEATLYSLVEIPYIEKETTPLRITIKKGSNAFEFDVGKPVREKLKTIAL